MAKLVDLTGKRFGKLTVLEREPSQKTDDVRWRCVCDCGNEIVARGRNLKQGFTKSCGCSRKVPRPYKATHGMSKTRLYRIWSLMKDRCENKNSPSYRKYGSRGIKVCDEWHSSSAFIEWALSNGYREDLSLDRIDFDGDYCPENCRWADAFVQGNNRRGNRVITLYGKTQTLAQWCREYNQGYRLVHRRITQLGWDVEKALTTPNKRNKSKQ